jgi:arylsulfatase A-like enzyme
MENNHKRPNIVYIMSDDHAAHAISCYGSRINETPNIDRIANEGMRFDNCFCTNSICAPSRATVLTGLYNHRNGVRTLHEHFDGRQTTFPKLLQADGYQTAMIGKWHLGHGGHHDPTGFDYWNILPKQGDYHDPMMIDMGVERQREGYVTDIITDDTLDWIRQRDPSRPFLVMCHHKAPHRWWEPDEKHANLYEDIDIPEPDTFDDTYENRSAAAAAAWMRIENDLNERDLKVAPPEGLTGRALKSWKYQRYIKDYLRCIASLDDNIGRLLDGLEEEGVAEDTIVVYTSDQGFFLGDHGWFDKRFMYEESLRMPFLVRYPKAVAPGSVCESIAVNVDFAPTFLDYAGVDIPETIQGYSLRPLLSGITPDDWRTAMYYRYWEHKSEPHNVYAHYGIRTLQYKLIYYYNEALDAVGAKDSPEPPEWELFDLTRDPGEMNNVYGQPEYVDIGERLQRQLAEVKHQLGDEQ